MSEVPARVELGESGVAPRGDAPPAVPARAWLALAFAAVALGLSAIFVKWAAVPGAVNGFYRMAIAAALLATPAHRCQARRSRTYEVALDKHRCATDLSPVGPTSSTLRSMRP